MDKNGRPTAESLNRAIKFISSQSGRKNGKVYDVMGVYFRSDEFKEMNSFANLTWKKSLNGETKEYSLLNNNCGDFTTNVLKQDKQILEKSPWFQYAAPYNLIEQYWGIGDYNFIYNYNVGISINFEDETVKYNENSKETSSKQSWWQRFWYGKIFRWSVFIY